MRRDQQMVSLIIQCTGREYLRVVDFCSIDAEAELTLMEPI